MINLRPHSLILGLVFGFGSVMAAEPAVDPLHDLSDDHPTFEKAVKKDAPAKPYDEFTLLARQITQRTTWNNQRLAAEVYRPEALILGDDLTPVSVVLRRTEALIAHLTRGGLHLDAEAALLAALRTDPGASAGASLADQRRVFAAVAALRRKVAFRNPLLDFDRIVFLAHDKMARGERHMVDQYLGFNAAEGGGIRVLEQPFSEQPQARLLLSGSTVENGRLKGQRLNNRGSFVSLDLDYDGQSMLFAWTEADHKTPAANADWSLQRWSREEYANKAKSPTYAQYYWRPESTYHVFRAGVDGGGLRQLTDGPVNDYDPCFLPDGRVVFISERAGGNQRCGARPLPSATLHSMAGDGSDLIQLSWHDTNEWSPSVDNNGMLVYTRWDYVDRDSDVAHHLWRCYPDGRDPRAPHGNYPIVRESRPWMEVSIRAIPHSDRYVAVSGQHHGEAYGSLILIDLNRHDDRSMSQIKRLTPDVDFGEAEALPGVPRTPKSQRHPQSEQFGTPWPLSEDFYLCVYDPDGKNYGIWLVDSFGNRELLYRDPAMACLDPIPLRARPRPPVIPAATTQSVATRGDAPMDPNAVVMVSNVYASSLPWPDNTKITALRVVSIFPKPNALQDKPRVGLAIQSLTRGVLGTVPVEADGSAYFTVPAGVPFYLQALNAEGVAVQTMRSDTYAHPGERLSCIGCHESPSTTPEVSAKGGALLAFRRPPSKLQPEGDGSYPLSFTRLVQPVLDRACVQCHQGTPGAKPLGAEIVKTKDASKNFGWSQGYTNLAPFGWAMSGGNGTALKEPQYSTPGHVGALASKLYPLLKAGHHDVKLAPEDLRRITLWLDCNSVFYGDYFDTDAQQQGKVVQPKVGVPAWTDFNTLVR